MFQPPCSKTLHITYWKIAWNHLIFHHWAPVRTISGVSWWSWARGPAARSRPRCPWPVATGIGYQGRRNSGDEAGHRRVRPTACWDCFFCTWFSDVSVKWIYLNWIHFILKDVYLIGVAMVAWAATICANSGLPSWSTEEIGAEADGTRTVELGGPALEGTAWAKQLDGSARASGDSGMPCF